MYESCRLPENHPEGLIKSKKPPKDAKRDFYFQELQACTTVTGV